MDNYRFDLEVDQLGGDNASQPDTKQPGQARRRDPAMTEFSVGPAEIVKAAETAEDGADLSDIRKATQKRQSTKGKRRSCLQRVFAVILSHLGVFMLIVAYLTIGGLLFNYLEVENEISACRTKWNKYSSKRNEAVDRVYNIAQGANASLSKSAILTELQTFAEDVYTLGLDTTINCSTIGESDNMPNWALPNSVYFCATVITTIGYGHIAPVTMWGQIVCMIYAILGIPLMLLFLTKIGEPTAMLFRTFYLNICCCKCFITKDTFARSLAEAEMQRRRDIEMAKYGKQPPPKMSSVIVLDDDSEDDGFYDESAVNIPITVTLLLLILYILIGAAVFKIWEVEWSLIEGTYFSFITLSTIGFGDYVPGRNGPFDNIGVVVELLIGAVYCVFGLAMLSMCMNLIQDELSAKLVWLGLKLGIADPDDYRKGSSRDADDSDEDVEDDDDGDSDDSDSGGDSEDEEDDGGVRRRSRRRRQRRRLRSKQDRGASNHTRRSAVSVTPGGRKVVVPED